MTVVFQRGAFFKIICVFRHGVLLHQKCNRLSKLGSSKFYSKYPAHQSNKLNFLPLSNSAQRLGWIWHQFCTVADPVEWLVKARIECKPWTTKDDKTQSSNHQEHTASIGALNSHDRLIYWDIFCLCKDLFFCCISSPGECWFGNSSWNHYHPPGIIQRSNQSWHFSAFTDEFAMFAWVL